LRFSDIVGRPVRESFTNISVTKLGIDQLVRQADHDLEDPAASAINAFVGITPGASDRGEWGGIMAARRLEDAYSANPTENAQQIRQQLNTAFQPVRDALRTRFGDTIALYRGQGPVPAGSSARNTLSWTSDPRVAAWFSDIPGWLMKLKPVTDQQIKAAVDQYHRTGKVRFLDKTYVRTDQLTNDPASDQFYYEILDSDGDVITDGDNLRHDLAEIQRYLRDLIAQRTKKLGRVKKVSIPIDDIIWITDRAGQSEFILHNRPGSPGYISPDDFPQKT
jgi:hypothetical protein